MANWLELNKAVKAAISSRDFRTAEAQLAELRAEADRSGHPELLCNTHFTQGLLRDAQGRWEEAEAAFLAALKIDRELHGSDSKNVADTLHSVAIVRVHRGDHAAALQAFQEEAAIFAKIQVFHRARALCAVAEQLLALNRHEEALATFEESIQVARKEPLTPVHDAARAFLGAGETLRRTKQFAGAVGKFSMVTQLARAKMWPELADSIARAWYQLGIVSRYAIQGSQVQAAIAFWYASVLGSPAIRQKADSELAAMPEKLLATGDPSLFRVVYVDAADNMHLASARRGLFHFKGPIEAALGEVVEVTLDGYTVRAVTRTQDGSLGGEGE